jgi:hypothetical protein
MRDSGSEMGWWRRAFMPRVQPFLAVRAVEPARRGSDHAR